ncbi:MAG: peptide chain release factor 1 [Spirochaetes bacterium]|nr:peptide chain release factor 1 [Spirochaetota bacterium]
MEDLFEKKLQEILNSYNEIIDKLSLPEIVSNQSNYRELSKKKSSMEEVVEKIKIYFNLKKSILEAKDIISRENDKEIVELAKEELAQAEKNIENIVEEIKYLLIPKDENLKRNVIMEIRAGTGGEEAALFAADLFRMYSRYAERKNWKTEIISMNETGLGGFKEIIFNIRGENVYSFLKYEAGVHRVQRVPETEASGRIHTSAVSVVVLPEIEEDEIKIDPNDLKIDVFRASGAGGQHVNKTESAVRITHIPTGIVVTCQDEKSQIKNKARAMKILAARLNELEREKKELELAKERKEMIKTGDRSDKIRTYNFPQSRVTDHRINLTLYNLPKFMDGEIDEMIEALMVDEKERLLKQSSI